MDWILVTEDGELLVDDYGEYFLFEFAADGIKLDAGPIFAVVQRPDEVFYSEALAPPVVMPDFRNDDALLVLLLS